MYIRGLALRHANLGGAEAMLARLDSARDGRPWPALPVNRTLGQVASPKQNFGVPPIYRSAIHDVQFHLLELAAEALDQAGLERGQLEHDFCDIVLVTAWGMNRSFENEVRAAAVRWARSGWEAESDRDGLLQDWRAHVVSEFRPCSHDKVGEMASALAARIAANFQLHGRVLAMEAGEHGGLEGLRLALHSIHSDPRRHVLVLGVQTLDSPACRRQPVSFEHWREAACALVLSARSSDGDWGGVRFERQPKPEQNGMVVGAHGCPDIAVDSLFLHTHCVQALLGLAASALLRRHRGLESSWVDGHDAIGDGWRFSVMPSSMSLASDPDRSAVATQSVAVVGLGARFGDSAGLEAFWRGLSSPGHRFRPLEASNHDTAAFQRADVSEPLSYYTALASHLPYPAGSDRSAALAHLVKDVADEAWQGLAIDSLPRELPLLVVCASNLTLPGERSAGARMMLPRLVESLDRFLAGRDMSPTERKHLINRFRDRVQADTDAADDTILSASDLARIAARGRSGRCIAVEAACAGSLAALDIACESIRTGESGLAIVIGVELPVNSSDLLLCASQRMLASGVMASFCEQADGFTPGDGAGAVILARPGTARELGLSVEASLLAIGSSTDSRSMIAPNVSGQTVAMSRAFERVRPLGIEPGSFQFVETHGTGTLIGDETETRSLAEIYEGATHHLAVGALKSKFGHCFAAAGMASLIKTVLALRHEQIPANHFERSLKAGLGWDALGLDPLVRARPWQRERGVVRRAAINAFGTGGLNYHLLVEEEGAERWTS